MIFSDRIKAGEELTKNVSSYKNQKDLIVLAVPRGGVVVGRVLADSLKAPLDLVVTRKIGHPLNPEFAIAAVDKNGKIVKDEGFLSLDVDEHYIKEEAINQQKEILRRLDKYKGKKESVNVEEKTCLVVDDGVATGLTIISAIKFLKKSGAKKVVVAVPVIPKDKLNDIETEADSVIYLDAPEIFLSVGQFYENFPQVSDEEVITLLNK